jgi:pimeloyl-ACP methyl ester carboxylesterase
MADLRLDKDLLTRHSSFVADGIEERAMIMRVAGGECFATLYLPPELRDTGFVVCHSYALELLTLRRTERAIARTLAALGYPVIAPHRRGFGDSSGDLAEANLARQLDDIEEAWLFLSGATGVTRRGLVGARFGAIIAGVFGRDRGADRLLLANPVFKGASYFRNLIREMRFVSLTTSDAGPRRSMDDLLQVLSQEGLIDVLGHPIYKQLFDDLEGVDLTSDMGGFSGHALLIQVSKRPAIAKELVAFADTIARAGGDTRMEHIKEPPGATFGGPAFVSVGDRNRRVNVQEPILERLVELTQDWMES